MNFEPEESTYRAARNTTAGFRDLSSSGSGFSNYFDRPSYQDQVVPKYVKALMEQYAGLYNRKSRANPDLAAQGLYFACFWNGTEGTIRAPQRPVRSLQESLHLPMMRLLQQVVGCTRRDTRD